MKHQKLNSGQVILRSLVHPGVGWTIAHVGVGFRGRTRRQASGSSSHRSVRLRESAQQMSVHEKGQRFKEISILGVGERRKNDKIDKEGTSKEIRRKSDEYRFMEAS